MLIELMRYSSQKDDTLGLLFIDSEFIAYTIEDEFRTQKIFGETRIPAGEYTVELRAEGGFHNRYLNKYGKNFHYGMLHLKNVPNFKYVLIHIGNTDDDTAGCILVGNAARQNVTKGGFISNSSSAYRRIYPIIRDAILKGEQVRIRIKDNVLQTISL